MIKCNFKLPSIANCLNGRIDYSTHTHREKNISRLLFCQLLQAGRGLMRFRFSPDICGLH